MLHDGDIALLRSLIMKQLQRCGSLDRHNHQETQSSHPESFRQHGTSLIDQKTDHVYLQQLCMGLILEQRLVLLKQYL